MLSYYHRRYFPPTEQDLPSSPAASRPIPESESSSPSPEVLAARLPDPPTTDPATYGQPEAKKQKLDADSRDESVVAKPEDDKSEDDWEEVDKSECSVERLDDEPVKIDEALSTADADETQSASAQASRIIALDESHTTENLLTKDW